MEVVMALCQKCGVNEGVYIMVVQENPYRQEYRCAKCTLEMCSIKAASVEVIDMEALQEQFYRDVMKITGDAEKTHHETDEKMFSLLEKLGFKKGVEAIRKMLRFYA